LIIVLIRRYSFPPKKLFRSTQHFTSKYGTKVTVTLEIDAHSPEGFADAVARTVTENCKTLKFGLAEFEGE